MRKALLFSVLVLLLAGPCFAQWSYGPTTPFSYVRLGGEYFPRTGRAYFLGGRVGTGTTSGEIWSFLPDSGTFRDEVVAMDNPVSNYSVDLLSDPTAVDTFGLYVVGGRSVSGTPIADLQAYYPVSQMAATITTDPFPGTSGGHVFMPAQGTAVVNNKLYVFGGFQVQGTPYNSDSTYVYDPSLPAGSRWSVIPSAILSQARGYISNAVVDGKIYAIGGSYSTDGVYLHNTNIVECFDPANPGAGWVLMANLPDTSSESHAFGFDTGSPYGLGGHIILAPQAGWPTPNATCYDYDVAANTWTTFASVNEARRSQAAFFVPGTANSGGIPGMWIVGGRETADSPGATSSEYYQLTYTGVEEKGGVRLVKNTGLQAPAPNPFSGRTVLRYSLAKSGPASLVIYGITGQKVRTLVSESASEGTHEVAWDGRDDFGKPVGAGVYFARFAAGNVNTTQRIAVLR